MAKKIKMKANKPLSIDLSERTIEMVMTTNDVDRDGDIVETKGIDLTNFKNNSPFLWAHDARALPIGKVLEIDRTDTAMVGKIKFTDSPFADEVFKLYADGTLNAGSIRFDPTEMDYIKDAEGYITGYHILECELLEFSATPIPANANALKKSLSSVHDKDLKDALTKALGTKAPKDEGILHVEKNGLELTHKGELAPTAFEKSAEEAGSAGKIPVSIKSGEEASTDIKFDVVKRDGELITEAKIKEVCIVLGKKADTPPLTPKEPSRSDETSEEDDVTIKSAEATADEIRSRAAMQTALLESEQFCE